MGNELCVVYGPLIGIVVQVLRRVPFIGQYPKVVAAVLSVVAAVLGSQGWQQHAREIVQCIIIALTGAIGTYEVAIKPLVRSKGQPTPQ